LPEGWKAGKLEGSFEGGTHYGMLAFQLSSILAAVQLYYLS
jgi:hypothetical protein